MKIIDLSQEIFPGMPVFDAHPDVEMHVAAEHDPPAASDVAKGPAPSAYSLVLGDHTGTHVDAFNHFSPEADALSIDRMSLETFITSAFCIDLSYKGPEELIERSDLIAGIADSGEKLRAGDTLLLCSDHYRRRFGTTDWQRGPGLSADATSWLGKNALPPSASKRRPPESGKFRIATCTASAARRG